MQSETREIYWIGGSPCSGKSTIASYLATIYHLDYYQCDQHWDEHLKRADPVRHPYFLMVNQMTCDELWMRPPREQLQTVVAVYREIFDLVLQDIQMMIGKRILVEGAGLLPDLVLSQTTPNLATWIIPTPSFQYAHYQGREWVPDVLQDCHDAKQAFTNWMQRDVLYAQWIAEQTQEHRATLLVTDETRSLETMIAQVGSLFQLGDSM